MNYFGEIGRAPVVGKRLGGFACGGLLLLSFGCGDSGRASHLAGAHANGGAGASNAAGASGSGALGNAGASGRGGSAGAAAGGAEGGEAGDAARAGAGAEGGAVPDAGRGGSAGSGTSGDGGDTEGGTSGSGGDGGGGADSGGSGATGGNAGSGSGATGGGGQATGSVALVGEDFDPRELWHGDYTFMVAKINPSTPGAAHTWSVTSALPADRCSPGDVTFFGAHYDDASTAGIYAQVPNVASKVDCVYTVDIAVEGVGHDSARLRMINHTPSVELDAGAGDDSGWTIVSDFPPLFVAAGTDEDDHTITFELGGPAAETIGCDQCEFTATGSPPQVLISATPAPPKGTYDYTLSVTDPFGASRVVPVRYIYSDCLIAKNYGPVDPAPDGSLNHPFRTFADALSAASAAGKDVCLDDGANGFDVDNLILPSSPRSPNVLTRGANRAVVRVSSAAGVRFAPGYNGTLSSVSFLSSATSSGATTLAITDASPTLVDCAVTMPLAPNAVGVGVKSTAGKLAHPVFVGGMPGGYYSDAVVSNGTAIDVNEAAGGDTLLELRGAATVYGTGCTGLCRAIHVGPDAAANILTNSGIIAGSVDSTSTVVGIDVEGSSGHPATATIAGAFEVSATGGKTAIGIRLKNTANVEITNNRSIHGDVVGPGLSAGIADGLIERTGATQAGASSGLYVHDNGYISADGGLADGSCPTDRETSVGILLVGSTNATIEGHEDRGNIGSGISASGIAADVSPTARRVLPATVGIWLVQTSGVHLTGNTISPSRVLECVAFTHQPDFIAIRDGIPDNPDNNASPAGAALGSSGLVIERNVAMCLPWNQDTYQNIERCVGLELNHGGATGPLVVNNYLGAVRGRTLLGLVMNDVTGATVVNNTVEIGRIDEWSDPAPPAASLVKRAVEIRGGANTRFANNLLVLDSDGSLDDAANSVPLYLDQGAGPPVQLLQNSLFWRADAAAPLVRVVTSSGTADVAANALDSVPNVATQGGNLAAAPGWVRPTSVQLRGRTRLGELSPARGAGLPGSTSFVPADDIDGDPRPSGPVDIGWDQWVSP